MNRPTSGSPLSGLPPPITLGCAGLVATAMLIFATVAVRDLVGVELEPAAEAANTTRAAAPTATASVAASSAPAEPADPAAVRELRAKIQTDLERGRFPAFVDGLEQLLELDPEAGAERKLRSAIVDVLMVITAGRGEHVEKLFGLIEGKMGPHGIDLLYQLVTAHGGSRASARAGEMLADPAIRSRGSPALRIAYDLRMAPCAQKNQLFSRARDDGDWRTLQQLEVLKNTCGRRTNCCVHNKSPALQEAIDALRARSSQN